MNLTHPGYKLTYYKSGYFLILLFTLAIAGFWPSYFSQLLSPSEKFSFYIHVHAIIMILWVLILIIQPILIHKKKVNIHRLIGKISFVHVALIFITAILLVDSRIPFLPENGNLALNIFIPFKDLLVIGLAYGFAMKNRKQPLIHARFMICTSFAFIEPALVRLVGFTVPGVPAYVVTVVLLDLLIIYLIYRDRHFPDGRNIFIFFLCLYIAIQYTIFTGANFEPWISFTEWFSGLRLT